MAALSVVFELGIAVLFAKMTFHPSEVEVPDVLSAFVQLPFMV